MSRNPRVSKARLSPLFARHGFSPGAPWYGGWTWRRWNDRIGVSEWVVVGFAGKNSESVSVNRGVGVTRIIAIGLEHELLMEAADVKELVDEDGFWLPDRGRAIIETVERAKEWEAQLAQIAPKRTAEMAADVGPGVLSRTASARAAVEKYLSLLSNTEVIDTQLRHLQQQTARSVVADAERLVEWPGVLQVAGAEAQYSLAALHILHFQRQVEGAVESFIGSDPLENDQLMWRVQLLADALLADSGAEQKRGHSTYSR